jgi:hypothetical protein
MISGDTMSDKAIAEILRGITVLVDSRENANQHILKYFTDKNISYIVQKLDFGDYSLMIKACPEFCLANDIIFSDLISIERKNSLNEISANLSAERDRFERELERGKSARFILMVEEAQGIEKIINHQYGTQMSEKSFLATLFTFGHRYGIDINFIEKRYAGMFIYWQLYYWARNWLKEAV